MIKYTVNLEHDDFCLLLDVLRKAREKGLTAWDAAGFVCDKTTVSEEG